MIAKPEIAPAPNKNTYIIAALILVPIAIAGIAAYVAIKTTDILSSSRNWALCSPLTSWCFGRKKKLKHRKSSEAFGHTADSLVLDDLESVRLSSTAVRQDKAGKGTKSWSTPSKTWHPTRSQRLAWSFGRNSRTMSAYQGPYESSNALVPTRPSQATLAVPFRERDRSMSLDDALLSAAPAPAPAPPLVHSRMGRSDT